MAKARKGASGGRGRGDASKGGAKRQALAPGGLEELGKRWTLDHDRQLLEHNETLKEQEESVALERALSAANGWLKSEANFATLLLGVVNELEKRGLLPVELPQGDVAQRCMGMIESLVGGTKAGIAVVAREFDALLAIGEEAGHIGGSVDAFRPAVASRDSVYYFRSTKSDPIFSDPVCRENLFCDIAVHVRRSQPLGPEDRRYGHELADILDQYMKPAAGHSQGAIKAVLEAASQAAAWLVEKRGSSCDPLPKLPVHAPSSAPKDRLDALASWCRGGAQDVWWRARDATDWQEQLATVRHAIKMAPLRSLCEAHEEDASSTGTDPTAQSDAEQDLSEVQKEVLTVIHEAGTTRLTQPRIRESIARKGIERSESAVARACRALEGLDLIIHPESKRGYTLTSRGRTRRSTI